MLSIEMIKSISDEFITKLSDPEFSEHLIENDLEDNIDDFFETISLTLIEFNQKQKEKIHE